MERNNKCHSGRDNSRELGEKLLSFGSLDEEHPMVLPKVRRRLLIEEGDEDVIFYFHSNFYDLKDAKCSIKDFMVSLTWNGRCISFDIEHFTRGKIVVNFNPVFQDSEIRAKTLGGRMLKIAYSIELQEAREMAASQDPRYLRRVAKNALNNTPRLQVNKASHVDSRDKEKAKNDEERLRQWFGTPEGVSLYRRASEPLVAQFLGLNGTGHAFLENGGSAIRATEYDDFVNATDIIYTVNTEGLIDKEKLDVPDSIVLSVDVTTARSGKSGHGVDSKFNYIGFERPYEIQWTVDIDYCGDPNPCYVEKRASHFIIGLSEKTMRSIASGIVMDKNGYVAEYDFDKAIDFMVASELYEQVLMHESNLPEGVNDEHSRKLQALEIIFRNKVAKTLGLSSLYDKQFNDRYFDMQDAMKEQDEVYAVTIEKNRSYMKQ